MPTCTACGRNVSADDRFCAGCGAALKAAPQVRSARASLHDVFAHLRSGEQRPATVLMTDVSGFSKLGENAEPEWLFHLINQVFEELVEILLAHGAHIDKFVGDEVVALFGVPVARERSVERAILSALAMRDRMALLNRQRHFGDVVLDIHTGINVGSVMVGPVGHRAHSDYTVIGDTVNVAKRLEEEAPAGEIYISEAAHDAAGDAFECADVGAIPVPGRRQPVAVYRVLGARRSVAADLRPVTTEQGVAPRDTQLRRLAGIAQNAADGTQQIVCVLGDAGIGKSRLIADWRRTELAGRFRIATALCHACGEHFPLLPVADVVAQLVGVRIEDWPPRVRGDLDERMSALPLDEPTRRNLAAMLQHLSAPPDSDARESLESLTDSFAALVRTCTRERPLCIILEDIQWMDEATQRVLNAALSSYSEWPLLSLLSARPPPPDWLAESVRSETVSLQPLSRGAMERLVADWAAPTLLPDSTVRAICDRAQGHPYFARELVRSLRDMPTASLTGEAGLPDTLQELFLAQLDALPIPLRRVVQAASVVGEPFSHALLEAGLTDDVALTEELLWQAHRRGLLEAGSRPGHFVFGPRLLFDTAYATIPPMQRQALHARIADFLILQMETMGAAAMHAAAHHAYRGYRDERAVDLLVRSAELYRAQYANRQAIQAGEQALELITSLPEPAQRLRSRLEALLLLGQSYEVTGDLGRAESALAQAEVLADGFEDAELVGRIAVAAATLCFMQGRAEEAEARFRRAHEAWRRLGNATRAAHALVGMGLCAWQRGDRERALESYSRAAQGRDVEPWARAAALNNAGAMLLEEGRYAEAERYLERGLRANEEAEDRRGVAHSLCSMGELHYRRGRFDEAQAALREAMAQAQEMEDAQCLPLATAHLARVLCATGAADEARERLSQLPAGVARLDPELETVWRVAALEAGLPGAFWPHDPAQAPADAWDVLRNWPECPDDAGAACANAHVEALCIAVEGSLLGAAPEQASTWPEALSGHLPRAQDTHLARYGRWLVEVARSGPRPLPQSPEGTRSVFDVRAERLLEALGGREAND